MQKASVRQPLPAVGLLLISSALQVMPMRLTLRPFTFSNGVAIPADTIIALPVHAIHTDEAIYPNAEEFHGFRFSELRNKEGEEKVTGHQPIATSGELSTFGLGKHAW